MEFLIYQDNGAAYHWRIVAGDGATLGQSGSFASYDLAEQAAHQVRDGAASARFDARGIEAPPVDLIARRHASSGDSDAERGWTKTRQFQQRCGGEVASGTLIAPLQRVAGSGQPDPRSTYDCPSAGTSCACSAAVATGCTSSSVTNDLTIQ